MPVAMPVFAQGLPFHGFDPHTYILPPQPPRMTVDANAGLLNTVMPSGRIAGEVTTPYGKAIGRGHDIGPFAGAWSHVPLEAPDLNFPIIQLVAASSKSPFGVSSVRMGTSGGTHPVAVACMGPIGMQQNCGDAAPGVSFQLGVGLVIAGLNSTVQAGLTMGDVVGAFAQMSFDSLSAFALGQVFGAIAKELGPVFGEVLEDLSEALFGSLFNFLFGLDLGLVLPGLSDALSDGPFEVGNALTQQLFA